MRLLIVAGLLAALLWARREEEGLINRLREAGL